MTRRDHIPTALLALGLAAGCGGALDTGSDLRVDLRAPEAQPSFVTVTPALDVGQLFDPSLAERLVIEEITVNTTAVRLLGADPRIPTGGLTLTEGDHILSTLAQPSTFAVPADLAPDDLSVFLRLGGHSGLGGASVIVRARLYQSSIAAAVHSLEAADPEGDPARGTDEAADPEGDPAMGNGEAADPEGDPARGTDEAADPEGDPAKGDGEAADPEGDPAIRMRNAPCAADPEGDPAKCARRGRNLKRGLVGPYVHLELRGEDIVDLVLSLDRSSHFEVVVGVPADRWLTSDTVKALDASMSSTRTTASSASPTPRESSTRAAVILSSTERTKALAETSGPSTMPSADEGSYRLFDGNDIDPASLRSR
jgi:hypothetical protein